MIHKHDSLCKNLLSHVLVYIFFKLYKKILKTKEEIYKAEGDFFIFIFFTLVHPFKTHKNI